MTYMQRQHQRAARKRIENEAQKKFDNLPDGVKEEFGRLMARQEIGNASRLLWKSGFTVRQGERLTMIAQDLI